MRRRCALERACCTVHPPSSGDWSTATLPEFATVHVPEAHLPSFVRRLAKVPADSRYAVLLSDPVSSTDAPEELSALAEGADVKKDGQVTYEAFLSFAEAHADQLPTFKACFFGGISEGANMA